MGLIWLTAFDSTNILVGSSHFDILMTISVDRVCRIFSVSLVGWVLEVGRFRYLIRIGYWFDYQDWFESQCWINSMDWLDSPESIRLSGLISLIPWSSQVNWMFSFIVSKSGFLINRLLVSSDLLRSCTVCKIIPLEQISLADASEWFPFLLWLGST